MFLISSQRVDSNWPNHLGRKYPKLLTLSLNNLLARQSRILPFSFMIVRQKPTQTFVFRILPAMNLDFHLQTQNFEVNLHDHFRRRTKLLMYNND